VVIYFSFILNTLKLYYCITNNILFCEVIYIRFDDRMSSPILVHSGLFYIRNVYILVHFMSQVIEENIITLMEPPKVDVCEDNHHQMTAECAMPRIK
jgi:hypothetical protein